jgi:DNA-binding PadR family transcriptional regulator
LVGVSLVAGWGEGGTVSATRLLVLGAVRLHGEAHGYQVRRTLLSWSADRWANVKPGSIYHALKKLAAEQLLESVRTEETGVGPERTAYRITAAGEDDFFSLLQKAISAVQDPVMLNAALPFITTLDRANAIFLFSTRVKQVRAVAETSRLLLENTLVNEGRPDAKPAHIGEMFRYWSAGTEAELEWLQDLVERLRGGEYTFADDSPTAFGNPQS